ncbi:unnamed protein product [Cladocopium goreaui]|uniref:CTP synthase n=1 Tax=Cladocopium goreaui TaxID=2562237 RepID=A0A9P1C5F9_9DINO|nr:unnamed protein product [Cladocopium goreaui]
MDIVQRSLYILFGGYAGAVFGHTEFRTGSEIAHTLCGARTRFALHQHGSALCAVGSLLQAAGVEVTVVKIDPYLNEDAGTLSPEDHGEVFVLDDGTEVDLDFGHYERALGLTLCGDHSITSGKLLGQVLQNERQHKYLGQTVRLTKQAVELDVELITRAAECPTCRGKADVCLIELGGAVGDWDAEIHLEALRRLQRAAPMVFCLMVPLVAWGGEQKTKLAQDSVRRLRACGIAVDFLICRTDDPVADKTKSKLADLCDVHPEAVWASITMADISQLPLHFYRQGVLTMISSRLRLTVNEPDMGFFRGSSPGGRELEVAVNGKYEHQDAYISIFRALEDAARACDASVRFRKGNCDVSDKVPDALCVPGGFGARGFEELVELCRFSRVEGLPFLGICWGFQAAVIALARDFGYPCACSQEVEEDAMPPHAIVVKRRDGILRKGASKVRLPEGRMQALYAESSKSVAESSVERYRNRFEVWPGVKEQLQEHGVLFGFGPDNEVDAFELPTHPFYMDAVSYVS